MKTYNLALIAQLEDPKLTKQEHETFLKYYVEECCKEHSIGLLRIDTGQNWLKMQFHSNKKPKAFIHALRMVTSKRLEFLNPDLAQYQKCIWGANYLLIESDEYQDQELTSYVNDQTGVELDKAG
jgi:hypothetical protein